jgi:isopenicillin N synthase-like dioxygenase
MKEETISVEHLPIIDLSPYLNSGVDTSDVAHAIRETCKNTGFFFVKNHGVPEELQHSIIENA